MERAVILLLTLLCSTALLCSTLFASEADLRQIRELADRRLFDAAEAFYNERIQQPGIAEADKILLAAELIRAYSPRLLEPTQRPRIIQRLETLERNWLTPPPASATLNLLLAQMTLRLHLAMAYHSLGNYQRLEATTASVTNRRIAYQQAQSTLQDALARLKEGQQELHALRLRIGGNTQAALTQRMLALEQSIMLQQGIVRKSLALTMQVTEERNAELRQAIETLSLLTSIESKIIKAACHRLVGELDQCREILTQLLNSPLETASLTPACRLHAEAEWIRYQIARGNSEEARRHYTPNRADSHLYPDFDLARLELFLGSNPATVMIIEQAISRQLGPYWARRAELLVRASGNAVLNSAEMLATRAENHYRENQFAEAARLYEQAAASADVRGHAESMFHYNWRAARSWKQALTQLSPDESKIDYQRRLVVLLRKLVEQNPHHPEAEGLHLLAMNMQAQIVVSQPEALDDYLTLVEEHTQRWSDSSQLQDIRYLSVIFLERQGRLDEAAAMLPLLDLEQMPGLPPEIQRLRARQLDAEGRTQEAVDILIALYTQRSDDVATLHLFAEILTRQDDARSLNFALGFWRKLESHVGVERNSETWWSAREGIFVVLSKLNRLDTEARQSFEMLRVLYPDLGGDERRGRLMRLFE